MTAHRNFIGGEWSATAATRPVVNPATGEVIATVAESAASDVAAAVSAARDAFDAGPWRTMTAQARGRILFDMARIVRAHAATLADLETRNCGKPIVESEMDVQDAATCLEYYGGLATKIHGETLPVPDNALNLTLKEPVGVVGLVWFLVRP